VLILYQLASSPCITTAVEAVMHHRLPICNYITLCILFYISKLIYKAPLGRNFRDAVSVQRWPKSFSVLIAPSHWGMARLSGPTRPG